MPGRASRGATPHRSIDLAGAWDFAKGNPNIVVQVLDTGIDMAHPDLPDDCAEIKVSRPLRYGAN